MAITSNHLPARSSSAQKLAEDALERARNKALVALDSISDGVISTDEGGRIEFVNAAAEKLLGVAGHELLGREFGAEIRILDQVTRQPIVDLTLECLRMGRAIGGRGGVLLGSQEEETLIEYSASALLGQYASACGTVVVMRNVTEERRLDHAMSYQATHDSLTGLVNRLEFERRLQRVLQQSLAAQTEHAMFYLDLDQFKVINDTCGHSAGDELLRQVAVILGNAVRKRDTVARLGGDEFGILMEHCTLPQASRVAHEIREKIAEYRFRWDEQVFGFGVSIGLVQITEASGSIANLFKYSDAACYAAKEHGRNRVHVYDPGDVTVERRYVEMPWVAKITAALQDHRFLLEAQPALRLNPQENLEYVEILIRYPDANGVCAPREFLPAAERYNLSNQIDRWVISTLLAWYVEHRDSINPRALFALNLSALSLSDETLLAHIHQQFTMLKVPAERFCFEIAETAAIGNMASALQFFHSLKARGCRFALDDFGSGLASFGYLRSLPVDYLKIDGVFVRDCVTDPIDFAMVRSINDIAHVMGIKTIAEFVEDEKIAAKIRSLGVDYAQGYGICLPLSLDDYLATRT